MNVTFKSFLLSAAKSLLFWALAFLLFIAIRYNGLEEEMAIFTDEEFFLPSNVWYIYAIVLGVIIGIFYAIIEFLFDSYLNKRIALGLNIVIKSIIYFILIIILLSIISVLVEDEFDIDISNDLGWWRKDHFFWNTVIYFNVASIVFSFIKIANNKFGRGVFFNMLIGRYRKPKEEERILMFLDLKDSTTIAEQLGHKRYSRYIQDCFFDLNTVLNKHEAEVYQYVGDEAVISWTTKRGFKNNNCVHLFFAFQLQLNKREAYYLKTYNSFPVFKAGLHCGKLMIAEVGSLKKELAYHGDVINTASRIQGLCNSYNASILISDAVLNKLKSNNNLHSDSKGAIKLKGKESVTDIFEISIV